MSKIKKTTIIFYFWWIRKLEKHHLIDLIKSFPMVPISSSHTSYWESSETILIFAPVSKIFDTGFGVNFAKHKPLLSTLSLLCAVEKCIRCWREDALQPRRELWPSKVWKSRFTGGRNQLNKHFLFFGFFND